MSRFTAIAHAQPPEGPMPSGPPVGNALLSESHSILQLGRLTARTPVLRRAPRGDGAPAVVIPGWRSPEASMAPIRGYLRRLGHDARHWGFGTNLGDPQRNADLLAARVELLAAEAGRPVALVGWSLGGVIARETARRIPDAVSQILTCGTPVIGGPTHTIGASSLRSEQTADIAARQERLDTDSPTSMPITAIFTRRDRVVAWTACIDRQSPNVRHIEVASTHLSLGIDPDVWLAIAEGLAPDPS